MIKNLVAKDTHYKELNLFYKEITTKIKELSNKYQFGNCYSMLRMASVVFF